MATSGITNSALEDQIQKYFSDNGALDANQTLANMAQAISVGGSRLGGFQSSDVINTYVDQSPNHQLPPYSEGALASPSSYPELWTSSDGSSTQPLQSNINSLGNYYSQRSNTKTAIQSFQRYFSNEKAGTSNVISQMNNLVNQYANTTSSSTTTQTGNINLFDPSQTNSVSNALNAGQDSSVPSEINNVLYGVIPQSRAADTSIVNTIDGITSSQSDLIANIDALAADPTAPENQYYLAEYQTQLNLEDESVKGLLQVSQTKDQMVNSMLDTISQMGKDDFQAKMAIINNL